MYGPDILWYGARRAARSQGPRPYAVPDRAVDATQFDVALELTREDTLTSPLLPGFALALDALFGE